MQSSGFVQCCGINIISGFPYDAGGDEDEDFDYVDEDNDYVEAELAEIISELPRLEGTYCHCHLIALNEQQLGAEAKIMAAGYVPVGDFKSAHQSGARVKLYAKGLNVFPVEAKTPPKPVSKPRKPRALKIKPRRKGIWKQRK